MLDRPTLTDIHSVISSRESVDGLTPCDSPVGPTTNPCGPDRAHANLSARQAIALGLMTRATFGPCGDGLSTTAAPQRSLASKLQARMDVNGSPEYALTWKEWPMESGVPICALRASARRTSDKDYIGWPTPMAGSPATKAYNAAGIVVSSRKTVVVLKGWATPRARDHKGNGVSIARAAKGTADSLDLQCKLVCQSGTAPPSPLSARMDRAAYPLNPNHSRWLMGYPIEWALCAAMAMQSIRFLRRRSSRRS